MNMLEALREKDPAAWQRFDELELATYKQYDDFGATENYIYQEDLIKPARMAWLQAVLQDACQKRGWAQWTGHTGENAFAEIHRKRAKSGTEDIKYGHGASPAEALLRCYLEAIG